MTNIEAPPTRTPNLALYWHAQDAAADPTAFASYVVGALNALVSPDVWAKALAIAVECDRSMALDRGTP